MTFLSIRAIQIAFSRTKGYPVLFLKDTPASTKIFDGFSFSNSLWFPSTRVLRSRQILS